VVSGIPTADNISGLTIDPADGTAYVSGLGAGMTLYTMDLGTGVATAIGTDPLRGLMIDIAIGPQGVMYGHDISDDSIYTVDTATGLATLVGPTGVNSNFAQGMDFDNADGTLYAYTYQGGGANQYGTIDLATGALTPLAMDNPQGEFEGTTQTSPPLPAQCSTPNAPIPDGGPGGVSDSLVITLTNSIDDLNVYISTMHTWVGDLVYTLTHQDTGTQVAIVDQVGVPASGFGCFGNDINAWINDEGWNGDAENTCNSPQPTLFGHLVGGDPANDQLLALFDNETFSGTWTLDVSDVVGGEAGTLNQWCLEANVDSPGLNLEKTVNTFGHGCPSVDSLVVPPGTDVEYCYNITNTGNTTITQHFLDDSELGNLVASLPFTLTPGASTGAGVGPVTISSTVVNVGTWTGYPGSLTGGGVVDASDTAEVIVSPPQPVVCNAPPVGFDAGISLDWTVANNAPGNPVEWANLAGCEETGNWATGNGDVACASSDLQGGGSGLYDTELSLDPDTTLGLQLSSYFTDEFSLIAQLVVNGALDYDPVVDWLYLNYYLTPELSLQAP